MKFDFKLSNIEVNDIKIGEVEVKTEFSINEMIAMRKETEIVLEKMPRYLQQLATAYKAFVELDNEIDEFEKEYSRG